MIISPSTINHLFDGKDKSWIFFKYHINKLKHLGFDTDNIYNVYTSSKVRKDKGILFENLCHKYIQQKHSNNVVILERTLNSDIDSLNTIELMKNGIPIIIEACFQRIINNKVKLVGYVDALIRSDYVEHIFKYKPNIVNKEQNKPSKFSSTYHYIPFDFKFSKIPIYKENNVKLCELRSTKKKYINQLLFYMDLISHTQGYKPQYGGIIGKYIENDNDVVINSVFDCFGTVYNESNNKNILRSNIKADYNTNINTVYQIANIFIPENITIEQLVKIVKNNDIHINIHSSYDDLFSNSKRKLYELIHYKSKVSINHHVNEIFSHKHYVNTNDLLIGYDTEFITDIMISHGFLEKYFPNLKPHKTQIVYQIGIYVNDLISGETYYKSFLANGLTKDDEYNLVKDFEYYISKITNHGRRQFQFIHYTYPEITSMKKWIKNYKVFQWIDLKKNFLDINNSIKTVDTKCSKIIHKHIGGYGLKPIVKYLYENKLINCTWFDTDINGDNSTAFAIEYYRDKSQKFIVNKIEKYNEIDCKTMIELYYLLHKISFTRMNI